MSAKTYLLALLFLDLLSRQSTMTWPNSVKSESESYSAMSDFLSVLSDSFCTVRGILQASTLEWVAFPFSSGSSQPRD